MKIKRKAKVLTATAVVGAVFTYLMDPQAGRARRERLARFAERRRADLTDLVVSLRRVAGAMTPDTEPAEVETASPIGAQRPDPARFPHGLEQPMRPTADIG